MKYAFMSFSAPQLSFQELTAAARRYGYDGVELRTDANHAHGVELTASPEHLARVRSECEASGVSIPCLALSLKLANPTKSAVEEAGAYLKLASQVGAPRVRVFGGQIPEGISREESQAFLIRSMRQLGSMAESEGVTVCIETHDAWYDPDRMADIMSEVDHPNIAVTWDVMHTLRRGGRSSDYSFQRLKSWIRHVHFHDGLLTLENLQFRPMGDGEIDHAEAVRILLAAGYDGYISGEWINWEPYEDHLPREVAKMRQYETRFTQRR
ncbi:TIM barrel protein [Paenibacillus mesophilus]|uniref:sugar phosphate isomerase/epimerase family protein n=1 Tax=Paenibacillus mesophilus TaxID=2582849 RepID=UPI00110D5AF3|nr:sugar phosphate isomerase/epimerase family protein [Paenibacillus mesophilus]TMV45281.1 TIM barrel protein [Paenibacillus mesophilus]